jgi:hypothetical protein
LGAFPALRAGNRAIRLYLLPPAASKGYRSYPLRESKPRSGFDFAEFHYVKLLEVFPGCAFAEFCKVKLQGQKPAVRAERVFKNLPQRRERRTKDHEGRIKQENSRAASFDFHVPGNYQGWKNFYCKVESNLWFAVKKVFTPASLLRLPSSTFSTLR